MKSYRELDIYKESKRLAIEVHAMTLKLPKFEMYEEGGQVRRSSKSVTSMIVEGYARRRYKAAPGNPGNWQPGTRHPVSGNPAPGIRHPVSESVLTLNFEN